MAGLFLSSVLPQEHLNERSKDAVRLAMGLIGTMTALVLGLLIASAKSSFDAQSRELTHLSANVALLDRCLAHYGPEAKEARDRLRVDADRVVDRMWANDHSKASRQALSPRSDALYDAIQRLLPKDEDQRSLRALALTYANEIGQTRWLMFAQSGDAVPVTVLGVLVIWLTIIFVTFGLFAPHNATVVASLFVAALSAAGAILLILEMYRPFEGLIQVPSAPLRMVISSLGR